MASEYTPTTEQVRAEYVANRALNLWPTTHPTADEFNRWLAQVKAAAVAAELHDLVEALAEIRRERDAAKDALRIGVAAERERCAQIAESRHDVQLEGRGAPLMTARFPNDGIQIAAAIREGE